MDIKKEFIALLLILANVFSLKGQSDDDTRSAARRFADSMYRLPKRQKTKFLLNIYPTKRKYLPLLFIRAHGITKGLKYLTFPFRMFLTK